MASICREICVALEVDAVWDAVRDIGKAHERLFPGVLTGVELTDDGRIVTFANGLVLHEPTVDIDDDLRRYSWTAKGSAQHYNSSLQVFGETNGSRIVWMTDILPDDLRGNVSALMDAGTAAMKASLER